MKKMQVIVINQTSENLFNSTQDAAQGCFSYTFILEFFIKLDFFPKRFLDVIII